MTGEPLTTDEARDLALRWLLDCSLVDASHKSGKRLDLVRSLSFDESERERLFAWVRTFVEETWTRTLRDEGGASPPNEILAPVLDIDRPSARTLWESAMDGHWPPDLDEAIE